MPSFVTRTNTHASLDGDLRALLDEIEGLDLRLHVANGRLLCDAPAGTVTTAMRERLAAHREELIRLFETASSSTSSGPRDAAGIVRAPASTAQHRFWYVEQLSPGTVVNHLPAAFRLVGCIDHAAMQAALGEIVRRHEPLRSTFEFGEDGLIQVIAPAQPMSLPIVDLSSGSHKERGAQLDAWLDAQKDIPFDTAAGPLFRVTLLRLSESEHVLFVMPHHLVFDGWSFDIFLEELCELYEAKVARRPSSLDELKVRYRDFCGNGDVAVAGDVAERSLAYWRNQLRDAEPSLYVPTDRLQPSALLNIGAREPMNLEQSLVDRLAQVARAHDATLFMVLMVALKALLHRYSGSEDIIVGAPVQARLHAGTERLIGAFVNTVVLRTEVNGDLSVSQLIQRVREVCVNAYNNQAVPVDRVLQETQETRDLSHTPLYRLLFSYQQATARPVQFGDLKLSQVHIETSSTPTEMTIWVMDTGDGIVGGIDYSTDLFDAETIRRFIDRYQRLLESIATDARQTVGELPMLTAAERHQLLAAFNDTDAPFPEDMCVHQLFEAQAARTPDAVALVFRDQRISYRQLNARANQLAHLLREHEVGAGTYVGLCFRRTPDLIVGILAVLKAGGAYLPLDASYPADRLRFMCEDANTRLLVTSRYLVERLPIDGRDVICVDADSDRISSQAASNLTSLARPNDLAYVMYTSGSTGIPKGVEVVHRAIARLVFGNDYATFNATRIFLQLAPVTFDASTFEIWGALLHGATLVLAPEGTPNFAELEHIIAVENVTTLWLTASLFNELVDVRPSAIANVAEILTGGEALSVRHVLLAQERLQGQLINGYGPTENTTFTCCYRIPAGLPKDTASIPIGRPIANTQVYVLDKAKNPVPVGVWGELYTGGAGLAKGYLNRSDLTRERFTSSPFVSGDRLYRTGDRVRWRYDGNLEFLGRLDDQVKIRGFRIEPGEIESVLADSPLVAQCHVAVEGGLRERRLVAYVVPAPSENGTSLPQLKTWLRQRLPEYMVPAALIELDRLPLTVNGKIDERRLPASTAQHPGVDTNSTPRSDVERRLAIIWCDLLQVDNVGIDSDFFEIGGHSMLAARMFAKIEKEFGKPLPLTHLYRDPTIAGLATLVEGDSGQATSHIACMKPSGTKPPLYFLHGINGEAAACRRIARCMGPDQPVYAIHLGVGTGFDSYDDIVSLASAHLKTLVAAQPLGPYRLAGYSFGGILAYELARQLEDQGLRVDPLIIIDTGWGKTRRSVVADWLSRVWPMVRNFPGWLLEELRDVGIRGIMKSAVRTLRYMAKQALFWKSGPRDIQDVLTHVPVQKDGEMWQAMQRHLRALYDYEPEGLQGPVTLIRSRVRPLYHSFEFDLGWSGRTAGDVCVRVVPGNHLSILKPPRVQRLAAEIQQLLDAAENIPSTRETGGRAPHDASA